MSRYYPVAHNRAKSNNAQPTPFRKLQPSREDDLRHNISSLSRLLTYRSSSVSSRRPPLIAPRPPPRTTTTTCTPRTTTCSSFVPRQVISAVPWGASQQLLKPKLTAPLVLLPGPACSTYETFAPATAPSTTASSSPCLSPSTTSTTALTADRNLSPISVACSSPSLPPLLPSDSIELPSSAFSLPPPTASISSSCARPTIAANQTRVRYLQRGIVRLQLAVKVCEAQRARRSKFLALSGKNWNSLRNVPKLAASSSPRRAPPPSLTSASSPGTRPPTIARTTASTITPQQQLSAAAVNSKHRNLTLVNYPSMKNMSLSIGRISSFPSVEHLNYLSEGKEGDDNITADDGTTDITADVTTAKLETARRKQSRFKTLTFCKFYNKTGRCRRGEDCPFYHDPYRSLRHPVLPFLSDVDQLTGRGVPQGETKPTTPEQTKIGAMSRNLLFVLSCDDNNGSSPVKRKTLLDNRKTSIDQPKRPRLNSMIRYHHQCPQDEQGEDDSSDDEPTTAVSDNLWSQAAPSCSRTAVGGDCCPLYPLGGRCCSTVLLVDQKRGGDEQRRENGDDCVQIVNENSNDERVLPPTRMQRRGRRYFSMVNDDDEQSDESAD
eukprot:GHVS01056911.1.p1 GENE.GHVS01056911.1~~GHVS01056911.1.p1  ORF type:complete len:607 (+),score=121.39 GHVS01056911.1:591-2411(+)